MNLIPITDPSTGEEKVGALNLDAEDGNRILSCTFDEYAPENQPRVTQIPDDNIADYKYIDGEYVHDPLPAPPEPEPVETADDVLNALLGIENTNGGEADE